jgi:hypothetical protein
LFELQNTSESKLILITLLSIKNYYNILSGFLSFESIERKIIEDRQATTKKIRNKFLYIFYEKLIFKFYVTVVAVVTQKNGCL